MSTLVFPSIDLTLAEILEHHRLAAHASTLPKVLGDGYLYLNNPSARGLRNAFHTVGGELTEFDFCDYGTLTLGSLPQLLAERRVPYLTNALPLEKLEAQRPGTFGIRDFPTLKSNGLIHEQSHVIADALMDEKTFSETRISEERKVVLRSLIGEAYAFASELIASVGGLSTEHKWFLAYNSYQFAMAEHETVRFDVLASIDRFGTERVFRVLFLSFLSANFFEDSFGRVRLDRLFRLAEVDNPDPTLKRVARIGAIVFREFRYFTAGFFFRQLGLTGSLEQLVAFDAFRPFERCTDLRYLLMSLHEPVVFGDCGKGMRAILARQPTFKRTTVHLQDWERKSSA